ncbi:MAG: insulinase family protein [Phycisphaerales bacterium]
MRLPLLAAIPAIVITSTLFGQTLPTDPAVVTGQLDNGLRYVVQQNAIPPGRATVWIHIHSGSLNETEKQRGIAHYLEHMAFNGSEHFKPGELVPFFEGLGMTFGRDQNAFTNMSQTTYQLTLPKADAETLGKGMTFFNDVLCHLLLSPTEIDSERQIIQEERRRGLSGRSRTGEYVMERMTPGSIYGHRLTIGTEASINGVQQQDFKDYYGKWYGPSNATVIVVGDAPTDTVVKAIKEQFGGSPKKPRPTPQDLTLKPYDKTFAIVASDPELRSVELQIVKIEQGRPAATTVPQYTDDLIARLGDSVMNRRLSEKVAAGGTSYQSGRVGISNEPGSIRTVELSGTSRPEKWKDALNDLSMELQRARAFGFTARELDHVKKQMIAGAERAVETEKTAASASIMQRLNGAVTAGTPIMSAQQRLDLLKQVLPSSTAEQVSRRFAEEFDPKNVAFIAVMPSGGDVPSESQLIELGTKALAVTPTQQSEEAEHATTLMAALPTPGTITEQGEHAASKVWSGWLSNNVRVHYRFMDERQNDVNVRINLAGGELFETEADRGITGAANLGLVRPATKHLSAADIREIMTGRKVSVGSGGGGGRGGGRRGGGGGGGGGADSVSLSISGSPEELETGFQLAYLLLTEPKIEPALFEQYKTNLIQRLQEEGTNPAQVAARLIARAPFADDDFRHHPPTVEQVQKLTIEAAQARLDKLIAESPIEVTIVGDLPKEKALELVNRYIGSLPKRERIGTGLFADARKVKRPEGARVFEKTVESPTKVATVYSGFYGADESNIDDARALGMAARVLSMRMFKEVREEAQLVYSISAQSRPATAFPGFGTFFATAPADPSKAEALKAKLESMYQAFAKDGPTEEEVATAKKQQAKDWVDAIKEPATWMGRLESMDYRGTTLDNFLAIPDEYQKLTPKRVHEVFAKYYKPESRIVVCVKPTGGGNDDGNGGNDEMK